MISKADGSTRRGRHGCDGSVLLLDESIEFAVLSAMLSRDGQEIIDARDWKTQGR